MTENKKREGKRKYNIYCKTTLTFNGNTKWENFTRTS